MNLPHRVTGKRRNKIDTKISYYIKGSSFDPKAASLYSVALHAGDSHFTVGISNPKTGDVLAVIQYPTKGKSNHESLEFLLNDSDVSEILKNSTKNIFYSTSTNFTIIPSVFFNAKNVGELLAAVVDIEKTDTIQSTFVPEIDGHLAFTQNKEVTDLLKSRIGHVHLRHHFASLISTYHLYYAKENSKTAFIQYHSKHFTLCLMDGKKMILFNSFAMNSFEDVIYYTYYSMEQFGFIPSSTEIHLGGTYEQNSEVLTALQRYTKNIYHLKPTCCSDLEKTKADALINTIFDIQCG